MRIERGEILHGALQRRAVVASGDGHDLAFHGNAGGGEALEDIHDLPAARVADELGAQVGVGGVDGDIQRADFQIAYALQLALGEVRAGDVVSREEREARVIVLEVERFAQALRQLVDEAENAAVRAAGRAVHQVRLKVQSGVFALFFADVNGPGIAELHRELFVVRPVFIIEHIADLVPVDKMQLISGKHPSVQRRADIHGGDRVVHSSLLFGKTMGECGSIIAKEEGAKPPLLKLGYLSSSTFRT